MNTLLNNKVILVTGGAGLLGTEFIKAIASSGGIAIIADVNDTAGLDLKEKQQNLSTSIWILLTNNPLCRRLNRFQTNTAKSMRW